MFRFVTEQARSVGTFVAKVLSPRAADHGIRSELDTALSSSKVEERIEEATANSPHQVTDPKALSGTLEEAAGAELAVAELAVAELAGAELAEIFPTPKLSPQTPRGNGELEAAVEEADAVLLKENVEIAVVVPSPNTRPKTPTPEPRSAKRGLTKEKKTVKPASAEPRLGRKGKSEAKQVPAKEAVELTPKSKKRESDAEPNRTPKKSKRKEEAGKAAEELVIKEEKKETAKKAQTSKREKEDRVEKEEKAQAAVTPKAAKEVMPKAEKKATPKAVKQAPKKVTPKAGKREATTRVPGPEKTVNPKAEKKAKGKARTARGKKQLPLTEGKPKKRSITEVLQKLQAEEAQAEKKEAPVEETGGEGLIKEEAVHLIAKVCGQFPTPTNSVGGTE